MRRISYISILVLILSFVDGVVAQNNNALLSDTKREEIQRYFGYEVLPIRYLSLPYDAGINTNQSGDFVDIGFIFLWIIPILILTIFRKEKLLFFSSMVGFLLLFIISGSNSYVFSHTLGAEGEILNNTTDYRSYLFGDISFFKEPTAHIVAYFYTLISVVYSPLENLINTVSGDSDHITYPLLFSLFILITILFRRKMKYDGTPRALLLMIFWVNSFFWVAFSAGIVWYGFVNLVLGYFVIFFLLQKVSRDKAWIRRLVTGLFLTVASLWVLSAIVFRISQVVNNVEEKELGKAMMNPVFYKYQIGEFSTLDVLNNFYPQLDKALAKINSESESKILRIGTSFSYFIKDNNERVYIDNQLGLWSQLKDRYEKKNLVSDVMKANGIKYIIVDLNTPFIDKTPEKTLERKFKLLTRWLRDHQRLKLLCTNRVIKAVDSLGQPHLQYGMFGEIYYGGQYAIYEIF